MSKLIEKIRRVSGGEAAPLGFGTKASVKTPQMALGAILTKDNVGMAASAVERGVDALLISLHSVAEGVSELGQVTQLAANVPWGIWLQYPTVEEVQQVREMGCDFVLFEGARTFSALLREEGLGRIMKIDTSLSDSLVRAIDRLPIDALLIGDGMGEPLSVYQLMNYHRFVLLTRKPLLVWGASSMSDLEVEMLWEAGLVGVFLQTEPSSLENQLSALRQAIDKLPSSRKKPRTAPDVSLPYLGEQPSTPERPR